MFVIFKECLLRLSNSTEEFCRGNESSTFPPGFSRSFRPECILIVRNNQRAHLHAVCSYIWRLGLFFFNIFTMITIRDVTEYSGMELEYNLKVSILTKESVIVTVISMYKAAGCHLFFKFTPVYVCPSPLSENA